CDLTQVTRRFASGPSRPAAHYSWFVTSEHVAALRFREVPELGVAIGMFGETAIQANQATTFDLNLDGRTDFEHQRRNTLFVRDDNPPRFRIEELPPRSEGDGVNERCRPPEFLFNRPRKLAQMMAEDDSYQVIDLFANPLRTETALTVCNRIGVPYPSGPPLSGNWELGANTKLVDLDNDRRPDLIRVHEGGYEVLPNISSGSNFG